MTRTRLCFHAEYMGIMPLLLEKDNPLANTEVSKDIATGDPKNRVDANILAETLEPATDG